MSKSSELHVSSYSVTVACGTFEGATLAKARKAAAIAQARADADEALRAQWRAEARAEATAVAYRVLGSFVDGSRPVYDWLAFPNGPNGDGDTFDRHVSYGDSMVRIRVDEYGPTGAVASFWGSRAEAIALGVDGHVRVAWLRCGDDIWPIALGSSNGISAHVILPKQVTLEWYRGPKDNSSQQYGACNVRSVRIRRVGYGMSATPWVAGEESLYLRIDYVG